MANCSSGGQGFTMSNSPATAPTTVGSVQTTATPQRGSGILSWLRWLDAHFEEWLLAATLLAIILIINAEVINRYVISWVEIGNITTSVSS